MKDRTKVLKICKLLRLTRDGIS